MVYLLCTNHNPKSYHSHGVIDTPSNIWLSRPSGVTTLNHFTHFYTTAPQNYLLVTVARCVSTKTAASHAMDLDPDLIHPTHHPELHLNRLSHCCRNRGHDQQTDTPVIKFLEGETFKTTRLN